MIDKKLVTPEKQKSSFTSMFIINVLTKPENTSEYLVTNLISCNYPLSSFVFSILFFLVYKEYEARKRDIIKQLGSSN